MGLTQKIKELGKGDKVIRKSIIILFISIISLGITSCEIIIKSGQRDPRVRKMSHEVAKKIVVRIQVYAAKQFGKKTLKFLSEKSAKEVINFALDMNETKIREAAYGAVVNHLQLQGSQRSLDIVQEIAIKAANDKNKELNGVVKNGAVQLIALISIGQAIHNQSSSDASIKLTFAEYLKELVNQKNENDKYYGCLEVEFIKTRSSTSISTLHPNEKEILIEAFRAATYHLQSTKGNQHKVKEIAIESALNKNQELGKPVKDEVARYLALIAAYKAIDHLPTIEKLIVEFS